MPYIARLESGLRTPGRPIPGSDVAGVVEAIAGDVGDLRAGDEVFGGWTHGGSTPLDQPPATGVCTLPVAGTVGCVGG